MPQKKTKRGFADATGAGLALAADQATLAGPEVHNTPSGAKHRGAARAQGQPLRTLSITLPPELVSRADAVVLQKKQSTASYNRSALVQDALEAYLEERQ